MSGAAHPGNRHARALALAGVAQYALYTHELAADGKDRAERQEAALRAIFCTDPQQPLDVFGDLANLRDGIALLKRQLGAGPRRAGADRSALPLVGRYVGQVLRVSGRLKRHPEYLERLRAAIERARLAEADKTTEILDAAYQDTVSRMRPRLLVQGHPSYLRNPLIVQRVRTLLLAAVRCGILWRQSGGSLPLLILRRKALLADLSALERALPALS